MIGKNSEVILSFAANKESSSYEEEFLSFLNKKNKEKKNSHGEEMTSCVLNFLPEVYREKIALIGGMLPEQIKNHKSAKDGSLISEIELTETKRNAVRMALSAINDNSQLSASLLPGHQSKALTTPASELSGVIAHVDDKEITEQQSEVVKTPPVVIHPKHDVMPQRAEQKRQEIKPRTSPASIVERVLQAHAGTLAESAVVQKQSVNLEYPFLRWSGEHSVKVLIPADRHSVRNLTLLPSDSRAAEILSRKIGHLNGCTAEILQPEHDDEEHQRRNLFQTCEEEQE